MNKSITDTQKTITAAVLQADTALIARPSVIVSAEKHRTHAVHLLDIDNEDARILVQQAHQSIKEDFFTSLFPASPANAGTTQSIDAPLLNLFKRKS